MGSDQSPLILFEAVLQAAQELSKTTLVALVTQSVLDQIWTKFNLSQSLAHLPVCVEFYIVSETITMEDDPLIAIRQKKNSSLVTGIRLLKKRSLDAFVSAGNSGALVANATLSFPLLSGIKRPALLATLPTKTGEVTVIDVGGNVSCKAHHLVQFAYMGAAYQRCNHKMEIPRIGLLNIGVESKKGRSEVRQAYQILHEQLKDRKICFVGNVEGREVFQGKVDVLVTDGFTGNVLLKTSEGVSYFILDYLNQTLKEQVSEEQRALILRQLKSQFDYDEYAGAIICGIDGIIVKCHGQSTSRGMLNGILGAVSLVKNQFIEQIKKQLIMV
jgi:glycerol-3-phosphate acyltransferase PlsX